MFTRNVMLGDHNIYFYDCNKEKQNVLFSNLKTGQDQGCAALYVASEENTKPVRTEMGKFGLKIDDLKKLRVTTSHQFYMPDGEFCANRAIEQIKSNLDESLDRGLEGLCISTDVSKIFEYLTKKGKAEEWLEYERALRRTLQFPVEMMCAYSINQVKSNDQVFLELIQAHKNTVTAKKLELVDNEQICIYTITKELDRILGKESTELVFRFLERRFKLPRNQILPQIVDFNQCLELLLGEGAATIEKHILNKIYNKIEISNMCVQSG